MQSYNPQRLYSLRADASALGGYLQAPVEKSIPTLAPVSLPPVGGIAIAQSEAFTLDEIVSCSSARSRVSGRQHAADGSSSILVTTTVEDLNILEVVRAERIVMQLSLALSAEARPIGISIAGSTFEGLRLAGHQCQPRLNLELHRARDSRENGGMLTLEEIRQAGRLQGDTLVKGFKERGEDAHQWAMSRHRWMTSEPPSSGPGCAQASLVDALEVPGGARCCGHVVEIPGFGRVILGELLVSGDSVQLIGIRAELGCPVAGRVSTNAVGGGGARDT